MKIALDPTPFYFDVKLLDLPQAVADAGYHYMQLAPHDDFLPFYTHPKADDELVDDLKKACKNAGVELVSLLPVYRTSWPDERERVWAVRNWKRAIEIAARLGVRTINSEFSGIPERYEESEAGFYATMEEILPILEREGIALNFDAHPYDFVENRIAADRVIRGLNSPLVGSVYVACHTFHYGNVLHEAAAEEGDKLRSVYISDSYDHTRSHNLRYIANPPGTNARVHQHLKVGDGDVDFKDLFATLKANGFLDREDSIICSNVFAEDETAHDTSVYQRETIERLVSEA
ncbi:sugar phosphate isomerase/epimerase family protein [Bifidobacterium sp. ESL0732]|uniref:sugar phosphate isomerase/epimerase family protein n=1 Tax=Bifidobacterium sp. ESL0732 TaxID=2983222 RepID=UPI0023F88B40|nr:sugar phosphate isomerase/epimerase family protein [Bifidobacterium sp. ESL0732]WEV64322.1 sugar phosphate isomerase/epimerase [Bifidobacterium sp. ESL0732]